MSDKNKTSTITLQDTSSFREGDVFTIQGSGTFVVHKIIDRHSMSLHDGTLWQRLICWARNVWSHICR